MECAQEEHLELNRLEEEVERHIKMREEAEEALARMSAYRTEIMSERDRLKLENKELRLEIQRKDVNRDKLHKVNAELKERLDKQTITLTKYDRGEDWKQLIEQYKDTNPLLYGFYLGRQMESDRVFKLLPIIKEENLDA
jgi:hypothetical protein